jgi:hypothetical protein
MRAQGSALPAADARRTRGRGRLCRVLTKRRVHQAALQAFPRLGRAPTVAELLEILATNEVSELRSVLADLERQDSIVRSESTGEITVVYPYSAAPTRHRVILPSGASFYCMCAVDALGTHFMLRKSTVVESVCPQRGLPIRIRLDDGVVSSLEPPEVVVWRTPRRPGEAHDATTCCRGTNFFSSRRAVDEWRRAQGGAEGQVLLVSEAAARGKAIFACLIEEDA